MQSLSCSCFSKEKPNFFEDEGEGRCSAFGISNIYRSFVQHKNNCHQEKNNNVADKCASLSVYLRVRNK